MQTLCHVLAAARTQKAMEMAHVPSGSVTRKVEQWDALPGDSSL